MKRSYAIAFAAGLAVAMLGYFLFLYARTPEWKRYQEAYNQSLAKRGLSPVEEGIRMVIPPAGGEGERCLTCHLGMAFPHAARPPFQSHPPSGCALPIREIGCTACHRGDPLELTVEGAHGLDPFALEPLLDWKAGESRKFDVQAGCAACHVERSGGVLRYDEAAVADVAAGMGIFIAQGCTACHRIPGICAYSDSGPGLERVGLRKNAGKLKALLRSPQSTNRLSPMPPVVLPAGDLSRLVLFLLAQAGTGSEPGSSRVQIFLSGFKETALSDHFPGGFPLQSSVSDGKAWIGKVGCLGCHRTESSEAGVPDLRYSGWLRRKEFLTDILTDPGKEVPGTYMPGFAVPPAVRDSIVQYLLQQRALIPGYPESVFLEICAKCHGEKRDSKVVVLARKPPVFAKGRTKVAEEKFMAALADGRKGTAMAPWGKALPKDFLRAIYAYLAVDK
jgi:mono/diheme cytochrome c family protein